jgi:NAD(P)-dependent dehydrogenase (short-subunit alcohol dehydrogenase family)
MRIVVFGANGPAGRQLAGQALAAGHEVVAVTRHPEQVPPVVGAGRLQAFFQGPVLLGELADALLEGGVLGGGPLRCLLGPFVFQVADLPMRTPIRSLLRPPGKTSGWRGWKRWLTTTTVRS